ncbi:MAG TPA: hypothetical protein VGM67_16235 [Gemmatimonadaceae bacterium]|jgi:hypothetical protein
MATSLYDHKNQEPLAPQVPALLDHKVPGLAPPTAVPADLAPAIAAAEGERKHIDAATLILRAPAMSDTVHQGLLAGYRVLGPSVAALMARGKSRNEAWLIAGALLGYTGARPIPGPIRKATGTQTKKDEPEVFENPSLVNKALRGTVGITEPLRALVTLLEGIELLPDVDDRRLDPTRMMDWYAAIDTHYAVGNVLKMAEVGSVSRNKPASGSELYKSVYRLHFKGGLKDVTLLNPAQEEVIYAPGAMYYVVSRRVGKVKVKKGNHAHIHIYLKHVTLASPEYKAASAAGHVIDLRTAAFQH